VLPSCHLDANRDGCAGNNRGIVALRIGNIETTLDARTLTLPTGKDLLTRFGGPPAPAAWTPIVTSTSSLVLSNLQRTNEGKRAVMQGVLHGAQCGLGVVGAVQIVAGAQLQNDAVLASMPPSSDVEADGRTQALAINVRSVPASLKISRPPSVTVTVPFP